MSKSANDVTKSRCGRKSSTERDRPARRAKRQRLSEIAAQHKVVDPTTAERLLEDVLQLCEEAERGQSEGGVRQELQRKIAESQQRELDARRAANLREQNLREQEQRRFAERQEYLRKIAERQQREEAAKTHALTMERSTQLVEPAAEQYTDDSHWPDMHEPGRAHDHEESAARHDMRIDYLLQDRQGGDEWAEAWSRDLMGGLIQGGEVNP